MKKDINELNSHTAKSESKTKYKDKVLENVKMARYARKEIIKGIEEGVFSIKDFIKQGRDGET